MSLVLTVDYRSNKAEISNKNILGDFLVINYLFEDGTVSVMFDTNTNKIEINLEKEDECVSHIDVVDEGFKQEIIKIFIEGYGKPWKGISIINKIKNGYKNKHSIVSMILDYILGKAVYVNIPVELEDGVLILTKSDNYIGLGNRNCFTWLDEEGLKHLHYTQTMLKDIVENKDKYRSELTDSYFASIESTIVFLKAENINLKNKQG